jgi:feruloyl esterase
MVGALEQWVEQKKPPERIVASKVRNGKTERTRPLCPYPQVARYSGKGSTDDEANFVCAMPPQPARAE